ncbi:transporter [Aporhodopirellula aestuarii]|uniref:Transporter n=1 Tax=Aporhodopirellula aestuarii TaxID=2950107 RepID=A0ABT0UCE9_9BACT|nr:transporter [Aporhodopirellula aestuarii]MCM2374492.1 transporter [Aporhodopirellula aestuarii]
MQITLRSVLTALIGIAFACTARVTSAQSCDDGCDGMRQTMASQCGCNARGTVGSLFQWSDGPLSGTLAQPDEPLVTDRPDFTEASSVVGLGVLQLETGYTYTYDNDGTDRTIGHSYPETLLRYGVLANWLELRVAWNYGDDDVNSLNATGADDLYVGFKIGLTPQEGQLPEMAIIPQMTVPTGGNERTAGEVLAGLNWLYGWDINDFLATGGSTQFNRSLDETTNNGYTEWAQSWTIAYSLADRLGAYTEYFGFYPSGADTASPEHYFNGGFTYLINNDMQWDIRGGTGLNNEADDYFVGTGLSIRVR